MARILVAFFRGSVSDPNKPNAMPVFYEAFINGINNGSNRVEVYAHNRFGNDEWEQIPEELAEKIKAYSPEICIFFNNAFYDLTDIVDCPILVYASDSVIFFANQQSIKNRPERYYFFVYSAMRQVLIDDYGIDPSHITAYQPFTGVVRQELPIKANIAFIGSKFMNFHDTVVNSFMQSQPTKEEIKEYTLCMDALIKDPYLTADKLVKRGFITSNKVADNFDEDQLRWVISDERRIHVLSSVADLGLDLYGTQNWMTDYYCCSLLNLAYNNKPVFTLRDNQDIYNSCKIGISIGHIQAVDGFPWRTLDIMASSACLVTDYHADFKRYFADLEIPIYKDAYEAREICKELLSDEEMRSRIVRSCNDYVAETFPFSKVSQAISDVTGVEI